MKNLRKRNKGQSSLELSVVLIVVAILLVATVKIFVWLNELLVLRQQDYEVNRVAAGSIPQDDAAKLDSVAIMNREITQGDYQIDESNYPKLDIFK